MYILTKLFKDQETQNKNKTMILSEKAQIKAPYLNTPTWTMKVIAIIITKRVNEKQKMAKITSLINTKTNLLHLTFLIIRSRL